MRRRDRAGIRGHVARWLGALLLAVAVAVPVAMVADVGASGATVVLATAHSRSKSASAHADGLTVTLSATPDRVKPRSTVKLQLSVHAKHASGALDYQLAYGDGSNAPPIVIPEYCLAGNPPPASASWHFSHIYRSAGIYDVSATVEVNCGGGHVHVMLPVRVR